MSTRVLLLASIMMSFTCLGFAQDIPRPEHPMPQMVRSEWLNLNGTWEFAETDDGADESFLTKESLPDRITVPFCRESKLSGLERRGFIKNVWYRRTFDVPTTWKSPRVRLHIGACDWRTRVWVNGQLVGTHTGGSAAFAFDITSALKPAGNVVIVHAFDDTRSGVQPLGKQSPKEESFGCVYTRTTGIWQTVWLEGVGTSYIGDYYVMPDPENSRIVVRAEISNYTQGLTVKATAFADGKSVGEIQGPAQVRDTMLVLPLSEKRLWSPKAPFLYDIELTLMRGNDLVDAVKGYFGLRRVNMEGAAILINGEPIFQRLILDQGFYPQGVWTAPSDADLKKDIEMSMAAGFNGARLHQKVFEPRLLYWADKLGYMVWGEFPSWGPDVKQAATLLPFVAEWNEVVRRDRNHPAIVGWCPLNETNADWGWLQNTIVYATRQADPTRPVLDTSGYVHSLSDPEVLDAHDYDQNPASFRDRWFNALSDMPLPARYTGVSASAFVPFFVSEYGGIGWSIHANGWGYGNAPKSLDEFYTRYEGLTSAQLDNPRLFGFCYTQLTDIEQEQNGLYTYNREPKFDVAKLHAITSRRAAYEDNPPLKAPKTLGGWQVLVGAFPDGEAAKPWRYTTDKPAEDWTQSAFDAAKWPEGLGGFGLKGGWENRIRTPWSTKDIWMRQEFEYDGSAFSKAMLVIHYDNATEVYVNGTQIWSGERWNDNYAGFDVSETLKKALQKGTNTLAVHCHQDDGGQFIDLALLAGKGE